VDKQSFECQTIEQKKTIGVSLSSTVEHRHANKAYFLVDKVPATQETGEEQPCKTHKVTETTLSQICLFCNL